METNVNYTIVGAFVIVLIAAIVLGIIWLSSGLTLERYNTYLVYMQESVSGLGSDSLVEYNGVVVGKIKNIELNHKNPQLVEVLLDIKSTTPITRGTVAMLSTRGITGLAFIALKDKSTDLRPLVAELGQKYPVIKTVPSIFLRLDAALTQFSNNFHQISESIQALLDKENLKSIKESLINIKLATAQMGPFFKSGQVTLNMLQNQTLPAATGALNSIQNAARNMSALSADIKANPSALIRGSERQDLGPGERR